MDSKKYVHTFVVPGKFSTRIEVDYTQVDGPSVATVGQALIDAGRAMLHSAGVAPARQSRPRRRKAA